ncbi:putative endopeptidase Clp [Rosa chinensis]|uniref:Putative endopeptidase Clp n=1 Tax=Rosa chinensis TaxID=74649 RepID=A0A2P6PN50_ROSCH|nr:putative endopeptidase Clp [Rosa chinensis]
MICQFDEMAFSGFPDYLMIQFDGIFYSCWRGNYQTSFYEAQTGEFVLEAEELLKLRETITRVYAQRTGKPLWVVSEDMERDVFMSAIEAQAHGIVDLVATE